MARYQLNEALDQGKVGDRSAHEHDQRALHLRILRRQPFYRPLQSMQNGKHSGVDVLPPRPQAHVPEVEHGPDGEVFPLPEELPGLQLDAADATVDGERDAPPGAGLHDADSGYVQIAVGCDEVTPQVRPGNVLEDGDVDGVVEHFI